jgi:hypothetical protein
MAWPSLISWPTGMLFKEKTVDYEGQLPIVQKVHGPDLDQGFQ